MKSVVFSILVLLLVASAWAQRPSPLNALGREDIGGEMSAAVPDTTTPWRYFPMHVGDVWEYEEGPYIHRYYIEKDTLIGGRRYFKQVREFYDEGLILSDVVPALLRYDTTSHLVRWRLSSGQERSFFQAPCPFNADLDVSIECNSRTVFVRGLYNAPVVFGEGAGRGPDTVRTSAKFFDSVESYRYAAGIGLVYWELESAVGLSYYRVGGVERGRRRIVVAAEREWGPSDRELTIAAVYPNPFRNRVAARYLLGSPQEIRVEMFDALGRRVRHEAGSVSVTDRTVELNGDDLAPGAYLLRVCAKDGLCRSRAVVKAP